MIRRTTMKIIAQMMGTRRTRKKDNQDKDKEDEREGKVRHNRQRGRSA